MNQSILPAKHPIIVRARKAIICLVSHLSRFNSYCNNNSTIERNVSFFFSANSKPASPSTSNNRLFVKDKANNVWRAVFISAATETNVYSSRHHFQPARRINRYIERRVDKPPRVVLDHLSNFSRNATTGEVLSVMRGKTRGAKWPRSNEEFSSSLCTISPAARAFVRG